MNPKEFDKQLQEHIKNLLEISWEYIYYSNKINTIYIYCLLGKDEYFYNLYEIENTFFKKHKIQLIDEKFLVTDERQEYINENSMNEIRKIEQLFKEYNREVPFEIKIIYSLTTQKLDVKFSYETPFKNGDKSCIDDGFNSWMKSLGILLG